MKHSLAVGFLLLAVPIALLSESSADDAPPPKPSDVQDILVLTDAGPALLRLHVSIDGKAYPAAWEKYLDQLFADLDRDGDGFLSRKEAERVPVAAFLQSFLQGTLNLEAAAEKFPFDQVDADKDQRISRRELADYYRSLGFDRPRVLLLPDRGNAAALSAVLFQMLDRNRDGKLSKEELLGAADALRRVDLNEDEWITPAELLLHRSSAADAKAGAPAPEGVSFLPVATNGLSAEQTRSVLARYPDKLDAAGLRALLARPPQQEISFRLGSLAKDAKKVEADNSKDGPTSSTDEGGIATSFNGLSLNVGVGPSDGSVRGLHAYYRQQFDAVDADKRGFLERKQLADEPALAALFPMADRDGDGRLTAREFDAFLDLHLLGSRSFVVLTVTDQGLGLFDLLDENGDGRLSLRELHTSWARLRGLDRNQDGAIGRDEFPRRLCLRLTLGKPAPTTRKTPRTPEPPAPRGPAWFRKMDRNGDGYVSRREFLGPEELFQKIDTDGDGLLSPEEAERFDAATASDKRD